MNFKKCLEKNALTLSIYAYTWIFKLINACNVQGTKEI